MERKSILLLGPRQTGKSTLMKELVPHLTINLARETAYIEHLVAPQLIERQVAALPKDSNCKIFIDEIQRLPALLNTVQFIIDENRNIIFLLFCIFCQRLEDIYYYRDARYHEVDAVVDNGKYLIAIEIKWGTAYKKAWKDNVDFFSGQVKKKVKKIIIYRGETNQKDEDVLVVPFAKFMDNIEEYLE